MLNVQIEGLSHKNMLGSLIKKESLHIIRDKRTMLVVLVMPLVLLLLFGYAISTEVNDVRIAAVVSTHDDFTRTTLERLKQNAYFDFKGLLDYDDIDNALRRGTVDMVVVIRGEDGDHDVHIVSDGSNTIMAKAAVSYAEAVLSGGSGNSPLLIRTLYNPQLKSSYNFVPGILGMIFILICAIMTSVSIVSEKESGTMNLLLVTPAKPGIIIAGKIIPYFLLSCVLLCIMLIFSYTLLDLPETSNLHYIILVSLLYILLSLSIGLLISTIAKTQTIALIMSAMMFMVPVVMLSGMIFPIDNMPQVLQWISSIVPARWYISAMRKLMIQQLPLRYVSTELAILGGMTLIMLVLSLKKFYNSTK